jgi:hypothetical protein
MIYRPQFKYPTPAGFRDVPHEYYLNIFSTGVAAGVLTDWTPFQMDDDADFYCRALCGDFNNGTTNFLINFRDSALRNFFSDVILAETVIGGLAGPAYILNEEVFFPKASHIEVQVQNPTLATIFPTPVLRGVKRCRGCAA